MQIYSGRLDTDPLFSLHMSFVAWITKTKIYQVQE